jgi:hypothetical protein
MTVAAIDENEVVVSELAHGSPFAGMTVEQARVMNSALAGLPVEVYGGRFDTYPKAYIFGGMALPGMWTRTPLEMVGDLTLYESERVDDHYLPRAGLSRVLSASLVRKFTVLAGDPQYRYCQACGKAMPLTEKVWDRACLGSDKLPPGTYGNPEGEFEWAHGFECKACWYAF